MCKKHNWIGLYQSTAETDKMGVYVENMLTKGGFIREMVCTECGVLGFQVKTRSRKCSPYSPAIQIRKFLEAVATADRLKLQFPQI